MKMMHQHIRPSKHKIFSESMLRDLEMGVAEGEITYSRMVEILNSLAASRIEAWETYFKEYERWLKTDYSSEMAMWMAQPNKPGYFWANND